MKNNNKKQSRLAKETLLAIEKAWERMNKGRFLTEKESKKRLGL